VENVTDDIANAPLPTAATLRRRRSPLVQAWRFVALNVRFLSMITKGSH
jgi:hypothetical protein